MATYKTEYSVSNKATCKGCSTKIDKGVHRVAIMTQSKDDITFTKWYHLKCFKVPKKGIEGGVEAFEGRDNLKEEDLEALKELLEAPPPKAEKKRTKDEAGATDEQSPVELKYKGMSVDKLKALLKANKQVCSGKKDDLVQRCVDGEVHGALPKCPVCEKSTLRAAESGEGFSCPGYFDSDAARFIRCKFTAEQVERIPWITDPSQAPASPPAKKAKSEAAASLKDDFKDLPPKEAALKLVEEAFKRNLSVPKATARQEVGTLLMATKDEEGQWDPEAALAQLAEKFPPEKPSAEATNPANTAIAAAFDEMGKLEGQGGDRMKANAYKAAANVIRTLDYVVTSGKAMAKAGPTKVPGIGAGIAKLIDEYLEEGTMAKLEELRASRG